MEKVACQNSNFDKVYYCKFCNQIITSIQQKVMQAPDKYEPKNLAPYHKTCVDARDEAINIMMAISNVVDA